MQGRTLLCVVILLTVAVMIQCVQYGVITQQVVNLRNEKKDMPVPPNYSESDPYQETQLVYQECITIESEAENDWIRITAPGQLTFYSSPDGNLHPYPGYIHASQITKINNSTCPSLAAPKRVTVADNLVPIYNETSYEVIMKASVGTVLEFVESNDIWTKVRVVLPSGKSVVALIEALNVVHVLSDSDRAKIPLSVKQAWLIQTGKKLLGWPYAWGGRSSFDKDTVNSVFTGVDCSGFVSFVYWTAISQRLPRNANDQYLIAKNITRSVTDDFQVGDLFFLGKLDVVRMTHVMMYVGDGNLMESSESTRLISVTKRMSVAKMSDLTYGCEVYDRGVYKRFYWGRVLE